MTTNKEVIRQKYIEDIQMLKLMAARSGLKFEYLVEDEVLKTALEYTRVFHVTSALSLLASIQGKKFSEVIPTIEEIHKVFKALARVNEATK